MCITFVDENISEWSNFCIIFITNGVNDLQIVAEETASVRPLSAVAEIRVKLLDVNDNIPIFTHEVYNVTLPEDAPPGTTLTRIQVRLL